VHVIVFTPSYSVVYPSAVVPLFSSPVHVIPGMFVSTLTYALFWFFRVVLSQAVPLWYTWPLSMFLISKLNPILSFALAFSVSFVTCIGAPELYTGFSSFTLHIPCSGFSMFFLMHSLLIVLVLYR